MINSKHGSTNNGFFSVLVAIIRESSDKQPILRIVKALPFIYQPHLVAPKASDVWAADWLYQQTWKNTIFFHVYCWGFSRSRKSLYNTAVYVIKSFYLSTHNIRCIQARTIIVPHNKLYLIKSLRFSFHINGQTLDSHPHQARITLGSIFKKNSATFIWMRLIHGLKGRNPSSPICKHNHLHLYDCKHIYGCITTVFIKYNDTRFRWTILTYPHNF